MSLSALRLAFRIYVFCLILAVFICLTTVTAHSQTPTPTPHVNSVTVFAQAATQTTTTTQTQQSTFLLEIDGTGFEGIADMNALRIIVFPGTGVGAVQVLSRSLDNSKILAQFNAPANYALEQVALSITGSSFATFSTGASACDFGTKAKMKPQIVPKSQAGNKYGNGVAKNFHVIQLSIVNECPMSIIVPLAGVSVVADNAATDTCPSEDKADLVPFSLDHVTSIYSADRKLTGRRAIYFNTIQALATVGSAVEPFFAHGFTQGVSILGGGFTTASKEILVDMSTEQLQNLTSQSFGATEQISSKGSLQKFVFVRRNEKCANGVIEKNLVTGKFLVEWELSPASTQAPTTQKALATPPPPSPSQ